MRPILLTIGSKPIPSFVVMVGLGVLLAFFVMLYLARKKKLDTVEIISYWIFMMLAFWLGSWLYKLPFLLFRNSGRLLDGPFSFDSLLLKGQSSVVGGILGAIIFSFIYLKKVGLPVWPTLDMLFTGIPLGQAVGRIGCFLGGCCYGRPTDLFLGIKFPDLPGPVHPTQLYESLLNFLNFLFLMRLFKRQKFEGQVFACYLMNYSIIRFVVEYWRGDVYRGFLLIGPSPWTSLSVPQGMCLIGFVAGLIVRLIRKKKALTQSS
jgi:phosphatidylglycerol---prolipoprotein diacylglyceryl transferase